MNKRVLSFVLLSLAIVCGCGDKTPGGPEIKPGSPPPPIDPSTMTMPMEISLTTIEKQIAERVPVLLKEKGYEGEPEGVKYTVTRGKISLRASGNVLSMTVPVSFKAEIKRSGGGDSSRGGRARGRRGRSGGESSARLSCEAGLTLTFNSRLSVGADWRMSAKTTAGPRKWTKPCEMTRLKIDVTKKVDEKLEEKVTEIMGTLDERITQAVDVRSKVTNAWESLQEPKRMEQGFWLAMNPQSIAMGPFQGSGKTLKTTVGFVAKPQISMTEEAPEVDKMPLPNNSGQVSGDSFYIALEATLSFEEATRQASTKMVGKEFDVSGQKVKVTSAKIYGSGDNFVIEAGLSGPIDATIALMGLPVYDDKTGILSVKNLDFTVDTESYLAKAANWLLHGTLQEKIAEKASFPLGEQIEKGKEGLEKGLNRQLKPTVAMKGTADSLRPLGVYVTSDAFLVIVVAEGKMWMEVK